MFYIERHEAAAVTTCRDQPARECECRECLGKEPRIRDVFEHDVDTGPIGNPPDLGGEILRPVVDAGIGTEPDRGLDPRISARCCDHLGAEILCRLNRCTAETASCSHHQYPFAGLDLGAVAELCKCQRCVPRHHGGRQEIQALRDNVCDMRRYLHEFGIAAPSVDAEKAWRTIWFGSDNCFAHDPVTDLAGGHAWSDSRDGATWIDAEDVR